MAFPLLRTSPDWRLPRALALAIFAFTALACGEEVGAGTLDARTRRGPPAEVPIATDSEPASAWWDGGASCDLAPCQGRTLGAIALAPCCLPSGMCGLGIMGYSLCFETWHIDNLDDFDASAEDAVVLDPRCPDRQVDLAAIGTYLFKGCCSASGVCGFSSASFRQLGALVPPGCSTNAPWAPVAAPVSCGATADGGALADGGASPKRQLSGMDASADLDAALTSEPY